MNFIEYFKSTFWVKGLGNVHRYTAFTLAEILIVLGIIGIIAQITIPNLISNFEEQSTITRLKKFYSTLEQASIKQRMNYEDMTFASVLSNFNVIKKCVGAFSCADQTYKNFNKQNNVQWGINDIFTQAHYAILNDGSILREGVGGANCNIVRGAGRGLTSICSEFSIDINGNKKPNQTGRDVFYFYITKDAGVIPFGTNDETSYPFSTCLSSGLGCAAWVIYNENMDYLKCSDLSWDGKKKCD